MSIRHKIGTIAGTMAVSLAFFSGTASAHTLSFNQKTSAYVATFIGKVPYVYGGSSPSTGFDCSGLTHYVYGHYGKSIPRTADAQFRHFRRESRSQGVGRGPGVLPRKLQPQQLRLPRGHLRGQQSHGLGHQSRRRDQVADDLVVLCDVRHDHPLSLWPKTRSVCQRAARTARPTTWWAQPSISCRAAAGVPRYLPPP